MALHFHPCFFCKKLIEEFDLDLGAMTSNVAYVLFGDFQEDGGKLHTHMDLSGERGLTSAVALAGPWVICT